MLSGAPGTLRVANGLVAMPDGALAPHDVRIAGGVIEAVGGPAAGAAAERVVDAAGCLVLPGLVNMHSHSYGTLCRHDGAGLPLEPWMNYAIAGTAGRTPEEIATSVLLHAVEALRTGTTALVDHIGGAVPGLDAVLDSYEAIGIRARVAPMIGDIPLPETVGVPPEDWPDGIGYGSSSFAQGSGADLVEATLALRRSWSSPSRRVEVIFGPSAPQRCSPAMLAAIADAARREQMPVHTHLLESRVQASLTPPGGARSWVQLLDEVGLLSSRLSTAHNVWLEVDDMRLLAERGVTLVHNPHSNLQLGSGIADLGAWRASGARIALGTDSVNCGGSADMIDAMRLAALLHRAAQPDPAQWETPRSALALATAGARALGIGSGRIEAGAPADLAIFDLASAPYATREDALGTLVLGSWNHSARTVIVAGKAVLEDYVLRTLDEGKIIAAAAEHRDALVARNGGLRDLADRQRPFLTAVSSRAPYPRAVAPVGAVFPPR